MLKMPQGSSAGCRGRGLTLKAYARAPAQQRSQRLLRQRWGLVRLRPRSTVTAGDRRRSRRLPALLLSLHRWRLRLHSRAPLARRCCGPCWRGSAARGSRLTRSRSVCFYASGLALVATMRGGRAHLQFVLRISPEFMEGV